MKTVLDLSYTEARTFFLQSECYCAFDLPEYFNFQNLINTLSKELDDKKLKECAIDKPKNCEEVNYVLLNNKDGQLAWRPYQLIHPAIYVSLVQNITTENNWKTLTERFLEFTKNDKIECYSLPVIADKDKSQKNSQILTWWKSVEQRSLFLALEYNHLLHLDITDCYSSLYTHSICWSIHTRSEAKKIENRNNHNLIGVVIDSHIQDMCNGQTNGIPQGSVLMDFIAEIVLGYGDLILSEKLKELNISNYKIIRYRDDYRIFTKSHHESLIIAKELSEILSNLNFKINSSKTSSQDDLILGSLKPDKVHWIYNKRKTDNIQQWVIQLYALGKIFPNSGALFNETKDFLNWLQKKANSEDERGTNNLEVIISILANLAYTNPRLYPLVTASMGFFIQQLEDKNVQREIVLKIKNKFKQLPNTNYLNVWLQRLTLKIDISIEYSGKICKKVIDNSYPLWNSDWLNPKYKKLVEETPIIDREVIESMDISFSKEETEEVSQEDYSY
jgi:RNA-directed DNA polymerase